MCYRSLGMRVARKLMLVGDGFRAIINMLPLEPPAFPSLCGHSLSWGSSRVSTHIQVLTSVAPMCLERTLVRSRAPPWRRKDLCDRVSLWVAASFSDPLQQLRRVANFPFKMRAGVWALEPISLLPHQPGPSSRRGPLPPLRACLVHPSSRSFTG